MNPATFRLVLLVSCAHALVHTFELSLPAVEQMIGADYGVGKEQTGALGTVWRLPFGLAALLAGWLADRHGSRLLLVIYLLGCAATAVLSWWAPSLGILFGVMFVMGCFASIYHPAGLGLIATETTPETRGAALGWHGILGSCGIAGAPFLASLVFSAGNVTWRTYYLLLTLPALLLAVLLTINLLRTRKTKHRLDEAGVNRCASEPDAPIPWTSFVLLTLSGGTLGLVYSGFMHFLPRYLDSAGLRPEGWSAASFRNGLAAVVLICGAFGQALAGRLARPGRLERLLVLVNFANVPPLLWMAAVDGPQRFFAACSLGVAHFMNQPIYNSLIAQFVPVKRRSLGYGFSNMVSFSIGALGPFIAGLLPGDRTMYAALAGMAAISGMLAVALVKR